MSWLFWRSTAKPLPAPSSLEALANTSETIENLETQRLRLLVEMETFQDEAKLLYAKNDKAGARAKLQRRQELEKRANDLAGMIDKLRATQGMVEATAVAADVFEAQKQSAEVIKNLANGINLEEVNDTQKELEDAMDEANLIVHAVSTPFANNNSSKDDDIEREMASWGAGEAEEPIDIKLPDVPKTKEQIKLL